MIESLKSHLAGLGLSEHEASVYGELLTQSPASASLIAKKARLSRSTVYTVLSALIAKGIVGTTYINNVKQFTAHDDAALEQVLLQEKRSLDGKFQALESLRTQLQAFQTSALHLPQMVFFEGQAGLKKIYLSMMRQAPKHATLYLLRDEFVWQPDWTFVFEQDWHDRVKRMKVEKNIATKLLINPSATEKAQAAYYDSRQSLDYRFLPKGSEVRSFGLYIIADMVSILSMEKNNLVGIHLTNAHLAENFTSLFQALWKKG